MHHKVRLEDPADSTIKIPSLMTHLDLDQESQIKMTTFMEISNQMMTSINIIQALMLDMAQIKVTINLDDSMSKLKISTELSNKKLSIRIGMRSISKDKRIKKTSSSNRSTQINMEIQKKKKSGTVATQEKRKNFSESTITEVAHKTSRISQVDLHLILMMNSMIKSQCSINSSMPNGNQSKKKFTKSMSLKVIPTSINQIEAFTQDLTCLLVILFGQKRINSTSTHSRLEIIRIGIRMELELATCLNNCTEANFINRRVNHMIV